MKDTLLISTGGTFNKYYHPQSGELLVDESANALQNIARKTLHDLQTLSIIGKDSLDMTSEDREELYRAIANSSAKAIIIIHGTDTMDISSAFLADRELQKVVIFTGAMVPYAIDPVEATANLMMAYGFAQANPKPEVYIAMNGVVGRYNKIAKDRTLGKFIHKGTS